MLSLDGDSLVVEGIGGDGARHRGGGIQDIWPSISQSLERKFRSTPLDIYIFWWTRSSQLGVGKPTECLRVLEAYECETVIRV
jgi:hypothetical protein